MLLVLTLFLRRFAVEQDISTHERILLVFVFALLENIRPIAKLIQLRGPIVILEVVIDIDEGKVGHPRPIPSSFAKVLLNDSVAWFFEPLLSIKLKTNVGSMSD